MSESTKRRIGIQMSRKVRTTGIEKSFCRLRIPSPTFHTQIVPSFEPAEKMPNSSMKNHIISERNRSKSNSCNFDRGAGKWTHYHWRRRRCWEELSKPRSNSLISSPRRCPDERFWLSSEASSWARPIMISNCERINSYHKLLLAFGGYWCEWLTVNIV